MEEGKEVSKRTKEFIETLPEGPPEDPRFILSTNYAKKYGLDKGDIAPACRKGAFISQLRRIFEEDRAKKHGRLAAWRSRWFVLDIPPREHPKWEAYNAAKIEKLAVRGGQYKDFDKWAPILLQRYDEARVSLDETRYRISDLAKMLHTEQAAIRAWSEIGVEGFGKLPRIVLTDDKKPMMEDGKYVSAVRPGRLDYWYDNKDIRRFLKKELSDPGRKFNTIDDMVQHTNIDEIAERHGYYVFDPGKCAPMTYEGFIEWAEGNVWFYDKGTRKTVPFRANEKQKEFYRKAFELDPITVLFKHKVLCASRPRGDYKSFDVTVLFLFRFFNMPEEQIFLVANSVQQTSHLLFNEAVRIIRRSPGLVNTPGLDIQSKGIYLMSGKKEIYSQIEVMSVESGARSNATCFAFSEVWKLTDEVNFAEIEQSIRGVDNGWCLIESTVSAKGHVFRRMYDAYISGEDEIIFFQYYDGSQRQNPKIDDKYLKHVQKLYPVLYKMFFWNRWEDAATGLFDEKRIIEMGAVGIDGGKERAGELVRATEDIVEQQRIIRLHGGVVHPDSQALVGGAREIIRGLSSRITWLDGIYRLPATGEDLDRLRMLFNCEFIIGVGIDRAKQLAKRSDRTAVITVAKGVLDAERRIFFVLDVYLPEVPSLKNIMGRINDNSAQYGWIDMIHVEEYQGADIVSECQDLGYNAELMPPSFRHQETIFSELSMAVENGILKCPTLKVWKDDDDVLHFTEPGEARWDLLREELSVFEYEAPADGRKTGYFGSPFKKQTKRTRVGEIKDDTVYGLAHAVFAANSGEVPSSMRTGAFSATQINTETVGVYE